MTVALVNAMNFIDGLDGDHTNVIGLALPTLRALLRELGIRWTDLWEAA